MRNLRIFLLYMAGVFLCMHNFVPHSHAEISVSKSTHEHHGDDHQHDGDAGSSESSPLELPSHQESVAKYIIKHNSEPSHFAPELLYHIPGVYLLAELDPITLSHVFPPGRFRFKWDDLNTSSYYLRGPPSLILS